MIGHEGSIQAPHDQLLQLTPEEIEQRELERKFEFSLGGHTLVDPEDYDGRVVAIVEVDPVSIDSGKSLPCRVHEVYVSDPFVAADPKGHEIVNSYIAGLEQHLKDIGVYGRRDMNGEIIEFGGIPYIRRTEAFTREQQNPYTRAWLAAEAVESLRVWRDTVPSAIALSYLGRPHINAIITNGQGESAVASPETVAHHRFVDDAIGIRERAVALRQLGVDHLAGFEPGSQIKWLSLASGTAEPSILAAKYAGENSGVHIDLTVADIDEASLQFVEKNVIKHQFTGDLHVVKTDILKPDLREVLASQSGGSAEFHLVENAGFEEYLPQIGDELALFQEGGNAYMEGEGSIEGKGSKLLQASEFTKRAWELVAPGGVLVSGNMILERPQFGFVFGIVDWPLINARSEESILRVYEAAGILDDPDATVEMYRVKDADVGTHVYNIVKVTKRAA